MDLWQLNITKKNSNVIFKLTLNSVFDLYISLQNKTEQNYTDVNVKLSRMYI